jgi:hypothetical protein
MEPVALGLFLRLHGIQHHRGLFGRHFFGWLVWLDLLLLWLGFFIGLVLRLGLWLRLRLLLFLLLLFLVLLFLLFGVLVRLILFLLVLLLLVLLLLLLLLDFLLFQDGELVIGLGIDMGGVEGDGVFIGLDGLGDGGFAEVEGRRGIGNSGGRGRIRQMEERVAAVVVGLGLQAEVGARGGIGKVGGGFFQIAGGIGGESGIVVGGGGI